MPRNTDYSKCVMYVIRHPELGLEYVGHTTNFNARKGNHKACASMPNPTKRVYQSIQANGGWTAWEMVKIAEFPCKTMQEATIEEERHRVERGSSLNMIRSHRTQEQQREYFAAYRNEHGEKIREYMAAYRNEHIKQIREQKAKYYAEHAEQTKERMAKYYADRRDQLKENMTKYRAEHRAEINARRRAAAAKKRAEAAK